MSRKTTKFKNTVVRQRIAAALKREGPLTATELATRLDRSYTSILSSAKRMVALRLIREIRDDHRLRFAAFKTAQKTGAHRQRLAAPETSAGQIATTVHLSPELCRLPMPQLFEMLLQLNKAKDDLTKLMVASGASKADMRAILDLND